MMINKKTRLLIQSMSEDIIIKQNDNCLSDLEMLVVLAEVTAIFAESVVQSWKN